MYVRAMHKQIKYGIYRWYTTRIHDHVNRQETNGYRLLAL